MDKQKYFKFVGNLLLFFSCLGIIFDLVFMISLTANAVWALQIIGYADSNGNIIRHVNGFMLFLLWIVFVVSSIVDPSTGLLFITVSELLDGDPLSESNSTKIRRCNERIAKLEKILEDNGLSATEDKEESKEETELKKEEVKPEISEVEQKLEEPVKEELIENDVAVNDGIVRGKSIYEINDRIIFDEDVEVDGIRIKKGSTGVIENASVSYGGRKYDVVLDGTGKKVTVVGRYFE